MNEITPTRTSRRTTHYIGGQWTAPGGRTFPDYNPYNGEVVAEVAAGGRSEAEAAIAAAHAAFPGWAATAPSERQRLFLKTADIVERRRQDIVGVMATEAGTGSAFAGYQVKLVADQLRHASGWGFKPIGDVIPSDVPGRLALAVRKPLGVVAGFSPWNGAFTLAWRTVLLPMVFGNTVVLKPSEEAPLSAGLLVAEIMDEAGFPPGVVNVVTHAPGEAASVADAFFESPAVRSINFTGSSAVGRMLAARAGQALKRIVLELGGYNPMLILRDADMAGAVDTTAFSAFFHQGQICMNARKVLIERPIHDEFVDKLAVKVRSFKSGDPTVPGTVIGPLINDRALHSVEERVQDAVSRGARLVTGGQADGRVYAPTILTDVPDAAPIMREETFGPVLIVQAVDSPEEAFAKATDTRYGLCASILTADQDRGLELAQRFDCGMVHINGPTMASEPSLPNGGAKESGWGRSGPYAVEDFTEIRLTTLTRGRGRYPI